MNKTALVFGIGAGLLLTAGAASAAGSCSVEISALEQAMGKNDNPNATLGPTDPGVQNPDPGAAASATTGTTPETTTGTTTGTETTTGPAPEAQSAQTGAGAEMGAPSDTTNAQASTQAGTGATMDSEAPAADVTANADAGATATLPAPTATETSRAGEMTTSAGGREAALVALAKAKNFEAAGQEDACMSEVIAAKTALGIQ